MLDCMLELDYPDPYDVDEEIFERDRLPQFLKDPKYIKMAIEDDLTFDEVVEAIYANEYEGFLESLSDNYAEPEDDYYAI